MGGCLDMQNQIILQNSTQYDSKHFLEMNMVNTAQVYMPKYFKNDEYAWLFQKIIC